MEDLTRRTTRPRLLTFDCYGTLIDWEGGILTAFRDEFPGATGLSDDKLLTAFHRIQDDLKTSEYRTYRELLAQVGEGVADLFGWSGDTGRREFIAESIASWTPFPDTNPGLERLAESGYRLGILSNIDDDLLAGTLQRLTPAFDLLVTAEGLRSYKPAPAHFERAIAQVGGRPLDLLHMAQSLFHDVRTASALGIPVVWVNRRAEPRPPDLCPTAETRDLAAAVDWLLAG